MTGKLIVEALAVGLVSAVVGMIIATALMFTSKNFKLSQYHFWPRVAFSYFITGFVIHLGMEAFGANRWYCKNGVACKEN